MGTLEHLTSPHSVLNLTTSQYPRRFSIDSFVAYIIHTHTSTKTQWHQAWTLAVLPKTIFASQLSMVLRQQTALDFVEFSQSRYLLPGTRISIPWAICFL